MMKEQNAITTCQKIKCSCIGDIQCNIEGDVFPTQKNYSYLVKKLGKKVKRLPGSSMHASVPNL